MAESTVIYKSDLKAIQKTAKYLADIPKSGRILQGGALPGQTIVQETETGEFLLENKPGGASVLCTVTPGRQLSDLFKFFLLSKSCMFYMTEN
ncbi:hypothetical protein ACOME3_001392 [Neoechinorhynchus agilis]